MLGAFVIVPVLYMLNLALESRLRGMIIPLAIAAFLTLAVFLSFSRGAWINLVVSLAIYGYLALATTRKSIVRLKIVGLLAAGSIIAAGVVVAALSSDQVANLLSERASFEQSYDTGAEGRFGGQEKAVDLIVENPLGIGAQEFTSRHHPEEVHNVYLTVLLSAGWLGGGMYLDPGRPDAGSRSSPRAEGDGDAHAVSRRLCDVRCHGIRRRHRRHRPLAPLLPADGDHLGLDGGSSNTAPAIERRAPRLVRPQPRAAVSHRRPSLIGPAPHPA